jgi:hypothetical protein
LSQRRGNDSWINPLLSQLNLIETKEAPADPQYHWKKIEECQLAERVGRVVAEINNAAGYRALDMFEFLPPQRKVLRVSFMKKSTKHSMEIVLGNNGVLLLFSTAGRFLTGWKRLFSRSSSSKSSSSLQWQQLLNTDEILAQDIQTWFSYLLSGLDKKFRPDNMASMVAAADTDVRATYRKVSA